MVNPFILLPFYAWPSGTLWDSLYTQVSSNPSLLFSIIVNVNTGPGTASPPATEWITALSTLNSYNNTQLLGYVHTSWAERALSDVEADIDVYASWATYTGADIHIDGIFFDEAPHDDATEYVNWVVSATDYARSKISVSGSTSYVVLNPGTTVSNSYYDTADIVVAAEDTYSAYSSSSVDAVQSSVREKSAFIINSFVDSTSTQSSTVSTLVDGGITGIYITDSDSYEVLSSIFPELISGLLSYVSPAAVSSSSTSAIPSTTVPSSTSSTPATYSATTSPSTTSSSTPAIQSTTFATSTTPSIATTTSSEATSQIATTTATSSTTAVSVTPSPTSSSWGHPHGSSPPPPHTPWNNDIGECAMG